MGQFSFEDRIRNLGLDVSLYDKWLSEVPNSESETLTKVILYNIAALENVKPRKVSGNPFSSHALEVGRLTHEITSQYADRDDYGIAAVYLGLGHDTPEECAKLLHKKDHRKHRSNRALRHEARAKCIKEFQAEYRKLLNGKLPDQTLENVLHAVDRFTPGRRLIRWRNENSYPDYLRFMFNANTPIVSALAGIPKGPDRKHNTSELYAPTSGVQELLEGLPMYEQQEQRHARAWKRAVSDASQNGKHTKNGLSRTVELWKNFFYANEAIKFLAASKVPLPLEQMLIDSVQTTLEFSYKECEKNELVITTLEGWHNGDKPFEQLYNSRNDSHKYLEEPSSGVYQGPGTFRSSGIQRFDRTALRVARLEQKEQAITNKYAKSPSLVLDAAALVTRITAKLLAGVNQYKDQLDLYAATGLGSPNRSVIRTVNGDIARLLE